MKKRTMRILSLLLTASMTITPIQSVHAAEVTGTIKINEVESNETAIDIDWVELINTGNETVDLSNWFITDNKDLERLVENEEWRITEGTILAPGEILVVENSDILDNLSLGKEDTVILYDNNNQLQDTFSYNVHAVGTYSRVPDGTGSFVIMKETKGLTNNWYKPQVVINEVESDCEDVATDWVEVYNAGSTEVNISGWYLYDNDPVGHAADITPVADGTILAPGEFYTFEINKDFTFGLGKNDKVTIYNKDGVVIDEFEYTGHAAGVYARIPDGTGDFVDFTTSTKGKLNIVTNPVVINEIQSKDPNGGADWLELANPTNTDIDVSCIIIKDDDDTHSYTIPEGTMIAANGFLVLDENLLGFGFGKGDSVRLYEGDMLIGSTTWSEHTNPTWGLYPDVNGNEYRNTKEETKGAINKFNDVPEIINWPGKETTTIYDQDSTFLEDSSGLDFYNGQLYAVDNGTGKFWVLDIAEDGSMTFAKGFENGKRVRFQKDADNLTAAGPDSEGISVDGNGMVYLACERDNSVKGVNYNTILMVDPNTEGNGIGL